MIEGTLTIEWEVRPAAPGTLGGELVLLWSVNPFRPNIGGFQSITWVLGVSDETLAVVLTSDVPGMLGALTVAIITLDGSVTVYFPTTHNIVELPVGSGRYVATVRKPGPGRYLVVWSNGTTTTTTELLILADSSVQTPIRVTSFAEYHIKAGNIEPALLTTIRNAGGDPVDLAGAVSVDATVVRKGDTLPIVEREIVILEPADEGQVVLDWLQGETDLPGNYLAEFSILWPSNGRSTGPSKGTYRFTIEEAGV